MSQLPTDENISVESQPPLQGGGREKMIVSALLVLCLTTAVGNWVFGLAAKKDDASIGGASSQFTQNLLQENADIGVISVDGTIMYKSQSNGFSSSGAGSEKIISSLQRAEKAGVKGILIKINSPGGTAAASQSIYEEILRIKKRSKIKFVATMGDVAASGGYYIASAADMIVANPATLTGSIGVIAQFTNIKGLYEKVGLSATVIKSGKHKDLGSPYRETTAEEKQIMQLIINDTYEDFVSAVAKGRKLSRAAVKKAADGRIYTGNQALKLKLVDQLGDSNIALDKLKKMTQLGKSAKIKDFMKPGLNDFLSMIGTQSFSFSSSVAKTVNELTHSELRELSNIPLMLYL